jgi:putative membrane protein
MKTHRFIPLLLSLVFLAVSCGQKGNDAQEDSKQEAKEENKEKFEDTDLKADWKFAIDVADASMLEVELGKLAQSKGLSANIKTFGQTMVADHTKANEELKALAATKNISLPDTLSDKSKRQYEKLSEKSGKDFDKDYADAMVDGHEDVLDLLKKEAEKGNDPDLKAWASQKISAIEHHLQMAKQAKEVADKNK